MLICYLLIFKYIKENKNPNYRLALEHLIQFPCDFFFFFFTSEKISEHVLSINLIR